MDLVGLRELVDDRCRDVSGWSSRLRDAVDLDDTLARPLSRGWERRS